MHGDIGFYEDYYKEHVSEIYRMIEELKKGEEKMNEENKEIEALRETIRDIESQLDHLESFGEGQEGIVTSFWRGSTRLNRLRHLAPGLGLADSDPWKSPNPNVLAQLEFQVVTLLI